MSLPEIGKAAPAFDRPATSEAQISLASLKGSKVILFFYPRDATPGCTTESQDFRDAHAQLRETGALVFGVSQDSLASHEKFKAKQSMPFELISDEDGQMCQAH